jgi:hypothetical protein
MKNLIALAALVVSSFVSNALADTVYVALFSGDEEVPARKSPIIGMAVLSVVDNGDGTGNATVVASAFNVDPTNPIQASHIHRAPFGENGPIVCGLTGAEGFTNPVVRSCADAAVLNLADLNNGLYYFNAHTPAFPGGESRGQIYPAVQ